MPMIHHYWLGARVAALLLLEVAANDDAGRGVLQEGAWLTGMTTTDICRGLDGMQAARAVALAQAVHQKQQVVVLGPIPLSGCSSNSDDTAGRITGSSSSGGSSSSSSTGCSSSTSGGGSSSSSGGDEGSSRSSNSREAHTADLDAPSDVKQQPDPHTVAAGEGAGTPAGVGPDAADDAGHASRAQRHRLQGATARPSSGARRRAYAVREDASCLTCGATGRLLRCSGCMKAFFCNTSCQRAAWPNHKPECKLVIS